MVGNGGVARVVYAYSSFMETAFVQEIVKCYSFINRLKLIFKQSIIYFKQESLLKVPCFPNNLHLPFKN